MLLLLLVVQFQIQHMSVGAYQHQQYGYWIIKDTNDISNFVNTNLNDEDKLKVTKNGCTKIL